jgi:lysozyme
MKLSPAGLALIERSEGFRAFRYLDSVGIPTIGYGHKIHASEVFAAAITEAQAKALLVSDTYAAEHNVNRLVRVPLTQNQFDALVDFTFNMGAGRLATSTLLRDLNLRQYDVAAKQLLNWDHGLMQGKETELAGLKARRQAEFTLWHTAA